MVLTVAGLLMALGVVLVTGSSPTPVAAPDGEPLPLNDSSPSISAGSSTSGTSMAATSSQACWAEANSWRAKASTWGSTGSGPGAAAAAASRRYAS